jgi:glycosyltransferase involved in cell wall biosynthesis
MLQTIAAADGVFALSNAHAAKIKVLFPDLADRLIALPPFVDLDAVRHAIDSRQTNRRRLAARHQLPTDVPWLIAAGPMATDGDLDCFRLLAQGMTALSHLKWRLIVAGAGSRSDEVGPLFGRLPVPHHRVQMVDTPAEFLALLACGDLFVWPATDDGLPLPIIEAQAAGLCVVANRTAATQDVVADGRTGMLTKPSNAASLGNAVSFLLSHPEFLRSHAEQGQKWAAGCCDMAATVSQLDATLHRLVRRARHDDHAVPVRAVD